MIASRSVLPRDPWMMILDRYLRASVLVRLALVSLVFTGVFTAYSAAVFLSRAAAGLMKPEFVVELVARARTQPPPRTAGLHTPQSNGP